MLAQFLSLTLTVESIRFPDRTSSIGQLINGYLASTSELNDQTIHLLFSANRWEASQSIENKLNAGVTLVENAKNLIFQLHSSFRLGLRSLCI